MFKIGDYIDYCFYKKLKVINKDETHYTLKSRRGSIKHVFCSLVDKHGKKTLQQKQS